MAMTEAESLRLMAAAHKILNIASTKLGREKAVNVLLAAMAERALESGQAEELEKIVYSYLVNLRHWRTTGKPHSANN